MKEAVLAEPRAMDLAMTEVCKNSALLRCVSVFPQLITDTSSHSNIDPQGENAMKEADGGGHSIPCSARVNAKAVLAGATRKDWKGQCE